uniref:RING-type domain-containing protein n=1 Tax=Capra hircus TaxID=9925 RepID=A0A8C2RCT0_CAPHI
MAGLDAGPAIPVWLAEDDLGCIICHDLLAWPATLPCGHTFCRDCLLDLWRRGRFCPTCREGAPRPPQLRKNTMLEALADKYRLAARELEGLSPYPGPDPYPGPEPGPVPRPAPRPGRPTAQLRVEAPRSITEVDRELAKLVERLIDIVRNLQSPRRLPESEPDKEVSILAMLNSQKFHLLPHAHCLTRAALHPRRLPCLLDGPSVQPLSLRASPVI